MVARRTGKVGIEGPPRLTPMVRDLLSLRDEPWRRGFDFSHRADPFGPPQRRP